MKHLLKEALDEANEKLDVSPVEMVEKYENIGGCPTVTEILSVAEELGLPFDKISITTQEDTFGGDVYALWHKEEPKTDAEILKEKRKRFTNFAYPFVSKLLRENEYKRSGYHSGLLKEFDKTTIYDLYMAEDYDMLVKYYSLGFNKDEEGDNS